MKTFFAQTKILCLVSLAAIAASAACRQTNLVGPAVNPTATPQSIEPTVAPIPTRDPNFVVIATDAPLPPFTNFDQFGAIEGFDKEVMDNVARIAGFEYEFVVTPSQGVLELLAADGSSDFDAVMSSLLVTDRRPGRNRFFRPLPGDRAGDGGAR